MTSDEKNQMGALRALVLLLAEVLTSDQRKQLQQKMKDLLAEDGHSEDYLNCVEALKDQIS